MTFEGRVWQELYDRFGREDNEPTGVEFEALADYDVPELSEMKRIGVFPERDAFGALVRIFAEQKNLAELEHCVEKYMRFYSGWRHGFTQSIVTEAEVIYSLFDADFEEAVGCLAEKGILSDGPRYLATCLADCMHNLKRRPLKALLCHDSTNVLGQVVCGLPKQRFKEQWSNVRLDIIKFFLETGASITSSTENSPLILALLRPECLPVLKLMAEHDGDFRFTSPGSALGIPDALFMAMYHNPNMVPFILKFGGLCMKVPIEVNKTNIEENAANWYSTFVCCELSRYKGMLQLMSEFSLLLPMCEDCKKESGLQSSIPSLQSICRMTYRSQFTPSQLLTEELNWPKNIPDLFKDYLLFRESPYDEQNFKKALAERDPNVYVDSKEYLVKDNVTLYSEEDEDYFDYVDEVDDANDWNDDDDARYDFEVDDERYWSDYGYDEEY
ncbi:hypothetical protein QR680_007456 [Steinernema hermaphroditum]|uniref:SOCS box domain-containing protein n=1 Tax=Steinernema hermaphroditum TaxID=289476 RepID=A0AA39ID77_9BILA|nr:hypothetical protein QR680_007456 [Steinernema hermaphroditum]